MNFSTLSSFHSTDNVHLDPSFPPLGVVVRGLINLSALVAFVNVDRLDYPLVPIGFETCACQAQIRPLEIPSSNDGGVGFLDLI